MYIASPPPTVVYIDNTRISKNPQLKLILKKSFFTFCRLKTVCLSLEVQTGLIEHKRLDIRATLQRVNTYFKSCYLSINISSFGLKKIKNWI